MSEGGRDWMGKDKAQARTRQASCLFSNFYHDA